MEAELLTATLSHGDELCIFFLHNPISISHTFPMKVKNPKHFKFQASRGLCNMGGPIVPPPKKKLEGSLKAVSDWVKYFPQLINILDVQVKNEVSYPSIQFSKPHDVDFLVPYCGHNRAMFYLFLQYLCF